jgi:hypothetical protein
MMMGDIWKQSGTISACIVDTGSTAKNGFDLLGRFSYPDKPDIGEDQMLLW